MYKSSEILEHDLPFSEPFETEAEIRKLNRTIEKLEHDLFFIYLFLASEGFYNEACDYLESHEDSPLPFELHLHKM